MPYTSNLPTRATSLTALALLAVLPACDEASSPTGVGPNTETALQTVVPRGGATDVDPADPVTVTFNHPMNPAMADYVGLHEGDVTGPEVAGTWSWSEDLTELAFTPDEPLKPATTYTIHLGGGLRDGWDRPVDCQTYGPGMGGQWAWGSMWGGGGPMMGGGAGGGSHMGDGWQHANGSYGMIFSFTTAG